MTEEFQYRRYKDGDAAEINRLYADITGKSRSLQEFEWQWLKAPGGEGDIWLIEAVNHDGEINLIGHHGIMPIRFSRGEENLLFGKTENTMVRAEYRRRILYPRFERRFAQVYEARFDALFSTMGPASAIRQRQAMAYEVSSKWVHVRIPTSWTAEFSHTYRACMNTLSGHGRERVGSVGDSNEHRRSWYPGGSPLRLRALADTLARVDPFFESFWSQCRLEYGVTPRRDQKDLDWRFWSNPHSSNITLVSDDVRDELGYVIIRKSVTTPDAAIIEDIVPCAPNALKFYRLLDSALSWMNKNNIRWVDFSTTDESCVSTGIASGITSKNLLLRKVFARFRISPVERMPRKITSSGKSKGIDLLNWYITPVVFEGRVS